MRLWNNLGLVFKMFLPQVLVIGVCVFMIVSAQMAIDVLNVSSNHIIESDAKKAIIVTSINDHVNELVVFQKNFLGSGSDKDLQKRALDSFADAKKYIDDTLTALIPTIKCPERKKAALAASDAIHNFIALNEKVFEHMQNGREAEALALSNGDVRTMRRSVGKQVEAWAKIYTTAMDVDYAAAKKDSEETKVRMVVISVLSLLMAYAVLGWITIVQIARPLNGVTRDLGRVASGDLDFDIAETKRGDEVGKLIHALKTFKDNAIDKLRLEKEQRDSALERTRTESEQKAASDAALAAAAAKAAEARRREMNSLAQQFELNVGGVVQMVSAAAVELRASAESLVSLSCQTTDRSTSVAAAAEEVSVSISSVVTAAGQLMSAISEVSDQAGRTSASTQGAVEDVHKTETIMQVLADGAKQIDNVVKLIQDIAWQTNLLALNATIEAARAGDAGKGFAVVASEVKNLADQTAKATVQIAEQIETMQSNTTAAVNAISGVAKSISNIGHGMTVVSAAVEEQSATTRDISSNMKGVAAGTDQVASNITQVSMHANESGRSAQEVLKASDELSRRATELQEIAARFVTQIKQDNQAG